MASNTPDAANADAPSGRNSGRHGALVAKLLATVMLMFGFGYALAPLYDVMCDVFGLNGKTQSSVAAATPETIDRSRTVTVEFMTTLSADMPWAFAAEQPMVQLHPGEVKTVNFNVRNLTDHDMVGQAIPSVAPSRAAQHLKKTECFCFSQQQLPAGDEKQMPVRFFVDPRLPSDVTRLTLSYTFFDSTEASR